ncbi:MAG: hypothetical protein ACF8AM_10740, partial [Rhodopirellula sp. JB055]|uniref:hypothetical protein n=1 Tax=Rhodopirellula sp. JB055 TaxID=3342846 RepID=UPI00370B74A4
ISIGDKDETFLTDDYDVAGHLPGWYLRVASHSRGTAIGEDTYLCNVVDVVYERCLNEGASDPDFENAWNDFIGDWNVADPYPSTPPATIFPIAYSPEYTDIDNLIDSLRGIGVASGFDPHACDGAGVPGTSEVTLTRPFSGCTCD